MPASAATFQRDPVAIDVAVSDVALPVTLADGRDVSARLEWFPRLRDATVAQRRAWRLIGRGQGIHRADLDDDVSVRGLLGLPA